MWSPAENRFRERGNVDWNTTFNNSTPENLHKVQMDVAHLGRSVIRKDVVGTKNVSRRYRWLPRSKVLRELLPSEIMLLGSGAIAPVTDAGRGFEDFRLQTANLVIPFLG